MTTSLTLFLALHYFPLRAEGSDQVDSVQCDCVSSNVASCIGKNLTCIPSSNALCEYPGVLNMSYNMLGSKKEPDCSNIPSSVRSLDLSYNMIEQVRDVCVPGDATALRKLNISNNRISALNSFMFQSCPDLSYLDLSNNKISSVEIDSFSSLVKLNYLDLSHNVLTTLYLLSFDALEVLLAYRNNISVINLEEPLRLAFLNLDCNNLSHIPEFDESWRGNLSFKGNHVTCPDKSSFVLQESYNLHCEEDQSYICDNSDVGDIAMYSSSVFSTNSLPTQPSHFIQTFCSTSESYYTPSSVGIATTQNTLIFHQPFSVVLIIVGFFVFLLLSFLFGLIFSSPIRKCCSGLWEDVEKRHKNANFPKRNSTGNDTLYEEIPNDTVSSPETKAEIKNQRKPFSGANDLIGIKNICVMQHVASGREGDIILSGAHCFDSYHTKVTAHSRSPSPTGMNGDQSNAKEPPGEDENNGYIPMKPIL